jgi:hypothetical protein
MTIGELQRIVLRLSNNGWCRYWCHFNHPQNPVTMAVQCIDVGAKRFIACEMTDLERLGFKHVGNWIYEIQRTNDDGSPYVSNL